MIFGSQTINASGLSFDLSSLGNNNSAGVVFRGINAGDQLGYDVSAAGDVTDDGYDDFMISAINAGVGGQVYLVYGGETVGFGGEFNVSLLASGDGSLGFAINAEAAGHTFGRSLSTVGDVDGNGVADILVGSNGADPHGPNSGSSYLLLLDARPTPAPTDEPTTPQPTEWPSPSPTAMPVPVPSPVPTPLPTPSSSPLVCPLGTFEDGGACELCAGRPVLKTFPRFQL